MESVLMNTNACGQLFIWQLYNIMDLLSKKKFYFLQAGIRVHEETKKNVVIAHHTGSDSFRKSPEVKEKTIPFFSSTISIIWLTANCTAEVLETSIQVSAGQKKPGLIHQSTSTFKSSLVTQKRLENPHSAATYGAIMWKNVKESLL